MAVEACGYRVALADVDLQTWALCPDVVIGRNDLERIGLVVPVAPFGRPVAQAPWMAFEAKTKIPVVIDGAATFDTSLLNPHAYFGEIPVALSFHATKAFGVGEGGAVVCTKPERCEHVVRALNFGFYTSRNAEADGMNGKMSEYHAAVGLAELDSWRQKAQLHGDVVRRYKKRLCGTPFAKRLIFHADVSACYALLPCYSGLEARDICQIFSADGIGFRFWYGDGLHAHDIYASQRRRFDFAITERLGRTIIGLPMAADLSEADADRVVTALCQAKGHDRAVVVPGPPPPTVPQTTASH